MKKILSFSLVIFLSFSVSVAVNAADKPDGKALYGKHCKMCHGEDGKGNDKMAKSIKVDALKLNLVKEETRSKKDGELAKVISDGLPKMKGFKGKLTKEEIDSIVKYLRFLQK